MLGCDLEGHSGRADDRDVSDASDSTGARTRFVSVLTPCYNEEENVEEVYERVRRVFAGLDGYTYEHLFIDNASTDRTVEILRRLAAADPGVKVIVNTRNFGHTRSPHHGLMQTTGEAVISIVSDLQDPPDLIPEFLAKWEEGYKVVLAIKKKSRENPIMFFIRSRFYWLINLISEVELVQHNTGFGLFDREVVERIREMDEVDPYFRGIISDLGYDYATIDYEQPARAHGTTKNNFYKLFDLGMKGIVSHSKIPLRMASLLGFGSAAVSLLAAFVYLVYKLVNWSGFSLGLAPVVIGLFFFSSVQLFFLGIIGEYVGSIHTQVKHRPLVVEHERINFGDDREGHRPAAGGGA
jgi:glycosyltransferase involved in cell wall biosynthesis